jgi:simple sugar transport system ATP-binding protein
VAELSKRYGLKVSPESIIQQLSVGERQRVEIIKALYREAGILILDEPTSVLNPEEAEELFTLLRSMAKEGRSVVVITHKLPEVMEVSDRVTVLRKGKLVGRFATKETNPSELAIAMVGHDISAGANLPQAAGNVLLELRDVHALNDKGSMGLKGLFLSLSGGEILGIAGVAGNGQSELVEVLTGIRKTEQGSIVVRGADVTNGTPNDMMAAGIGVVPEDRRGAGLIMEFSIADNLVLEKRNQKPFSDMGLLKDAEIRAYAEAIAKEYSIVTPDVSLPTYTLSGGNLQRLLLAKVLSRNPAVLVVAQPTAGLDVGATQFIWERLRSQRGKGAGILLISSDLNEILALSDRIACIYDGSVVGTMGCADADVKKIGLMMGGVKA